VRVLVLGAQGMLGRQVCRELRGAGHEVLRQVRSGKHAVDLLDWLHNLSLLPLGEVDWVINCAGVVKGREATPEEMLRVNSYVPRRLAELGRRYHFRVLQISTDCVFSGDRAPYDAVTAVPDARDLYGLSKLLGEPDEDALIIRCSFIGLGQRGLLRWLLDHPGPRVPGWTTHLWTGLTAREVARALARVIHNGRPGVCHLAGEPISKYQLVSGLARRLRPDLRVDKVAPAPCDRRLVNSDKFWRAFAYQVPPWEAQLEELAAEVEEARR